VPHGFDSTQHDGPRAEEDAGEHWKEVGGTQSGVGGTESAGEENPTKWVDKRERLLTPSARSSDILVLLHSTQQQSLKTGRRTEGPPRRGLAGSGRHHPPGPGGPRQGGRPWPATVSRLLCSRLTPRFFMLSPGSARRRRDRNFSHSIRRLRHRRPCYARISLDRITRSGLAPAH
jgi:hypothetical protein